LQTVQEKITTRAKSLFAIINGISSYLVSINAKIISSQFSTKYLFLVDFHPVFKQAEGTTDLRHFMNTADSGIDSIY
jgi:hypothetical protein